MIAELVEAALRSLLVALAVWAGLQAFRVRNVLAQKAAWGLVLVAAVVMPLLLPVAARWQFVPAKARVVLPADPRPSSRSCRRGFNPGSLPPGPLPSGPRRMCSPLHKLMRRKAKSQELRCATRLPATALPHPLRLVL